MELSFGHDTAAVETFVLKYIDEVISRPVGHAPRLGKHRSDIATVPKTFSRIVTSVILDDPNDPDPSLWSVFR